MQVVTIGLDIAKHVFQLHGNDVHGKVVLRRKLHRAEVLPLFGNLPSCTVGLEACEGARYWARRLTALGHTVHLMAPQFVKPFVSNKNDANDAEGICEAVARPSMRFVSPKSVEPRQHSSGGKARLFGISKRGDVYLRTLFIHGSRSVVYRACRKTDPRSVWIADKQRRLGTTKACVAVANKNARIVWSLIARGEHYRRPGEVHCTVERTA